MGIQLETERLILREHSNQDFEDLYKILADPITMQFWPEPFSEKKVEDWIQRQISNYSTGLGRLAVILKKEDRLIGDCGLLQIEIDGTLENDLGYIVDKEFWGQGFATEAAQSCLNYGKEVLGLERIIANMEDKHLASRAVAEKLGFKLEKKFLNPRNRNLPTLLLSI